MNNQMQIIIMIFTVFFLDFTEFFCNIKEEKTFSNGGSGETCFFK